MQMSVTVACDSGCERIHKEEEMREDTYFTFQGRKGPSTDRTIQAPEKEGCVLLKSTQLQLLSDKEGMGLC